MMIAKQSKISYFAAIHSNPTYIPYFITGFTNEMSFWQRAWNAYLKFSATVMMKVLGWHLIIKLFEHVVYVYYVKNFQHNLS